MNSYKASKLMGVNFSPVKEFCFEVHFLNCNLDMSAFDRLKLPNTVFKQCSIVDANFTQSNLSKAKFDGSNLNGTTFNGSNLTGADFSTAKNFIIDPTLNNIKKAIFSMHDLPALLYNFEIVIQ
jgi:fluoroquinolone resistance protein